MRLLCKFLSDHSNGFNTIQLFFEQSLKVFNFYHGYALKIPTVFADLLAACYQVGEYWDQFRFLGNCTPTPPLS